MLHYLTNDRKKQDDFTDLTRMYRIFNLVELKRLAQEDPGSLEYELVLKVKRNYNVSQWICDTTLFFTKKEYKFKMQSEEAFEMSRDFLFPAVNFDYSTQKQMLQN